MERLPRLSSRFVLGKLELDDGDDVEVQVGRTTIAGKFRGFDERLFAFLVEEANGGVVMIPYKHLKLIRKPSGVGGRRGKRPRERQEGDTAGGMTSP